MVGPGGLKSVYTGAMKHSQLLLVPLLAVAAVSVRRAASHYAKGSSLRASRSSSCHGSCVLKTNS